LTRRANHRHNSIIASRKTPMVLPDNGLFGAIAGKIRPTVRQPAKFHRNEPGAKSTGAGTFPAPSAIKVNKGFKLPVAV
jgi:hypothetical protein